MTDAKPIPKSLHTVTVLVKLAQMFKSNSLTHDFTDEGALQEAMFFLGYHMTPDTHGLRAAALKALAA